MEYCKFHEMLHTKFTLVSNMHLICEQTTKMVINWHRMLKTKLHHILDFERREKCSETGL